MTQPTAIWQHVKDLYVQCSLQVRNFNEPGFCMSDCCGKHATSVVVMGDNSRMFRCGEHEAVRRIETGPVEVNVRINHS